MKGIIPQNLQSFFVCLFVDAKKMLDFAVDFLWLLKFVMQFVEILCPFFCGKLLELVATQALLLNDKDITITPHSCAYVWCRWIEEGFDWMCVVGSRDLSWPESQKISSNFVCLWVVFDFCIHFCDRKIVKSQRDWFLHALLCTSKRLTLQS